MQALSQHEGILLWFNSTVTGKDGVSMQWLLKTIDAPVEPPLVDTHTKILNI